MSRMKFIIRISWSQAEAALVFTIVMWDSQVSQTDLTLLEQMLSLVVHNLTFHTILNLYLLQIRKDTARRPCSTPRYARSTDLLNLPNYLRQN